MRSLGFLIAVQLTALVAAAQDAPNEQKQAGQITKMPGLKEFVEAPYPPEAFNSGIEASVTLSIEIDDKGTVTKVEVLEPAGHGFDEAAAEAAAKFVFEPAEIDGKPAPVRIIYKYGFAIDEEKVEKPAEAPVPEEKDLPVNFRGKLLERGTRSPVAGIEVRVAELSAISGLDGRFELSGVPHGRLKVVIEEAGYRKFETSEQLKENEILEVTYYIERESYTEFETVVRAKREKKEVARRTMQIEEVVKIPGTFGDAVKVVENMPGVGVLSYTPGMLIIRGSAPEDSRAYIDGHLVPLIFHFGGWTTVVNSDLLKSVDFLPGGYGVRYGRTLGGIIDVKTRAGRRELHGYADIDIFDASLFLEGPVGSGSFMLAARRSYIDTVLPLVIPDEVLSMTVAPRYYDLQGKVDFSLFQKNDFSVFAYGTDDRLQLVMQNPEEFDIEGRGNVNFRINFAKLDTNFKHRFSERVNLDISNSLGTAYLDFAFGSDLYEKSRFFSDFVRADLAIKLTKALLLNLGTDNLAGIYDVKVQSPLMPKEGEVPDPWGTEEMFFFDEKGLYFHGAVFAELVAKPVKRLKIIPGARLDFYTQINKFSFDQRLAVRYGLTKKTTLKGSVGQYSEPPMPDEVVEKFGNPELSPERSLQYSTGVEHKFTDAVSVDAQVFYKDLWDLVVTSQIPEEVRCNCGVGRIYGCELLLRHELSRRFFGWLAYTLSRSERRDHPDEPWRLFVWDQTHILTAIASYTLPRNWTVSARFRLVSGQVQTPFLGGVYDADYDVYWPVPGAEHGMRMPVMHQLDARVDKRFIFDKWILNLYLDVQNVYNNSRVEGVDYSYDYSQQTQVTGLPVIPTLGIKGEF